MLNIRNSAADSRSLKLAICL